MAFWNDIGNQLKKRLAPQKSTPIPGKKAETPAEKITQTEAPSDKVTKEELAAFKEMIQDSGSGMSSEPDIVQTFEEYLPTDEGVLDAVGEMTPEEEERFRAASQKMQAGALETELVKSKLKQLESMTKDIDQELNEMLKKDEKAEEDLFGQDAKDTTFVHEVTVYDTVDRKENPDETKKQEQTEVSDIKRQVGKRGKSLSENEKWLKMIKQMNEVPTNVLRLILLVMGILVIALLVVMVVVFLLKDETEKTNEQETTNITITQPKFVANNSNYIFVDQQADIGLDITLQKMLIDPLATVFYFNQPIDISKFDIYLQDDQKRLYGLDLSFYPENIVVAKGRSILRFPPLLKDVKSFVLTLANKTTAEPVNFAFTLQNNLLSPAKYLQQPLLVKTDLPEIEASLSVANFSSSGSYLQFLWKSENKGETVQMGINGSQPTITMELGTMVAGANLQPNLYFFESENALLGRMDFYPVKNLSGKAKITFHNLYKHNQINEDINLAPLFYNKDEANFIRIPVGNVDIVLERILLVNQHYKLVLHGEKKVMPQENSNENQALQTQRIEVWLDSELVARNHDGTEIVLSGSVRSKEAGSDIDYAAESETILQTSDIPNENFFLRTKGVSIRIGDISTFVDLSSSVASKPKNQLMAEEALLTHYKNRLAQTAPFASSYNVQIIAFSLQQNGQVFAVLQDTILAANGKVSYRTYQTFAKFDNNGITILSEKSQ